MRWITVCRARSRGLAMLVRSSIGRVLYLPRAGATSQERCNRSVFCKRLPLMASVHVTPPARSIAGAATAELRPDAAAARDPSSTNKHTVRGLYANN